MTKAERTRQFIIEKAAEIFNQKGIAGTAISDIMEATKLAKGGIYGNFENKDEICMEAFDFLIKRLSKGLDLKVQSASTSKGKLFAILDYYYEKLVTSTSGGCPMLNFGVEADDTNPMMKRRIAEAIKLSQSRISNLVHNGIENGEFKTSVNAESFATKMFTMLEGAILTSRVMGSKNQMKVVTDILKADIETL